jgi:BASS family bile acid:Na+ symporter
LLSVVAVTTVFVVMFAIGLAIVPGEFRWVWRRPGLVLKGLFSVLVAVPVLALVVARGLALPHHAEVGIVLMAISPGAPVALSRSLGAGGHRSFAPALQIAVALLAVVSMPLWLAALDEVYGASATVAPEQLARQVCVAQLLPLGLGMLTRRLFPIAAARLEPKLRRIAGVALAALIVLVLIDIGEVVVGAGLRVALAIAIVTLLALGVGHLMGGPEPATRTVIAICTAARNPGLALLVATLNAAPPAVHATVLAYLVVSGLTLLLYAFWRSRLAVRRRDDG